MAGPYNGPATEQDRFVRDNLGQLTALFATLQDPSSVSNGWRTLVVDNLVLSGATAPTVATLTSTSMNVKGASQVSVYYDVTGATTGVLLTFKGGLSGFGFYTLRSVTASAGLQTFIVGDVTTGASAETNSNPRIDDIFLEATLAANTGAGTGVTTTIRTRFLTQP